MEISEILKGLRKESGLTQMQLAEKLHIGQATIACYENGNREPHLINLLAYADFFECSVDYLLGRTDDFGNLIAQGSVGESGNVGLSADEVSLIQKYRSLHYGGRMKIIGYLDAVLTEGD